MHDWSFEVLRFLAGRSYATDGDAAHQLQLPVDEVRKALAVLEEEGYVTLPVAGGARAEARYALTSAGHSALDLHR